MKQLRRICGSFVLLLALSITAFAGEINSPGIAGETQTPPGQTETPPGDTQTPGIAGEVLTPGLNFLLSIFF